MNLEHDLETTKSAATASKHEEQLQEQGQDVTITLVLPDGASAQHRCVLLIGARAVACRL